MLHISKNGRYTKMINSLKLRQWAKLMQNSEIAFIVKNHFPLQQKLTVITQKHGKIAALVKQTTSLPKIMRGSFISCTISSLKNTHIFIDFLQVIKQHTPASQETIYWFHHLLELCHYFIPQSAPHDESFKWISNFISLTLVGF